MFPHYIYQGVKMKESLTVELMKKNIIVRLSNILRHLVVDATNKELAKFLGVSTASLYKIKREEGKGLSINLLLSVTERLGLKYTLTTKYDGKRRTVLVTGLESSIGIQYKGIRRGDGIKLERLQ